MNMTQYSEASLLFFLFLWCFRSNLAGSISNPPQNVYAVEGHKIQIICIVQQLEDDETVSWFKDSLKISEGKKILNQQSNRYQMHVDIEDGHYFLTIEPVKRTDRNSRFSCGIYKNGEQIVISPQVQIYITEIPNDKYPDCQNKPTEYTSGKTVPLICTSESVDPQPKLRWLTDETNLDFKEEISNNMITLTHQLHITPNLDGKIFICNLKTEAKIERNCTVGPLNVVYKPQIELNGESMVKPGNVYICSVKANPKVTRFRWIFTPAINDDQFKIETGNRTLRLIRLVPEQNGTIMLCEATNKIGRSTIEKTLYLPPSNNPFPTSSTPGQQSKDSGKMSSTKILSFVGSCLLLLACLMAVLLCIFVAHSRRYLPGVRVPQPDVYFMPKDSISTMGRNTAQTAGTWKRSIGTQVPSDLDRESIYLEIGERKTLM